MFGRLFYFSKGAFRCHKDTSEILIGNDLFVGMGSRDNTCEKIL